MTILLTGGSGQLGQELQRHRRYLVPSHSELELTDPDSVQRYLGLHSPTMVVHAGAYTDTLKPERDPAEAAKCWKVNVLGTRHLVQFATCPIVYISTESALHPYNFYILTKIAGEAEVAQHHYGYRILRTSFRFNPFEYPKACTDMWTIADTVENITPLIDHAVADMEESTSGPIQAPPNDTVYIGTGVKTVYDLAKQTRPSVIAATREDVSAILPAMDELLEIECWRPHEAIRGGVPEVLAGE